MVYIAKEAWPEKKDFLKENINKKCQRLHINGRAIVLPTLGKQTKTFLNENTHAHNPHTPCFFHQLLISLLAVELGDVAPQSAVDGLIGDFTDTQEVWPQASHTKLGHIRERLTHTAAKHEASQLLVQA